MNILHNFTPQREIITFGPFTVYWYGVLIVIGIILAFFTIRWLFRKYRIGEEHLYSLCFFILVFGFIGDRLYHVLNEWQYYLANPIDVFKVWEGGLAIHGGIAAGILTLYLYAKRHKLNFWKLADIFAPGVVLAEAVGRWGNYFNQELYGLPTDRLWGIPISFINRVDGYEIYEYFHPTFLYQSLSNLAIFALLLGWHVWRLKKEGSRESEKGYGNIFLAYLLLYSVARGIMETVRIDNSPVIWNMRLQFIVSVLIIMGVLVGIIIKYRDRLKLDSKKKS